MQITNKATGLPLHTAKQANALRISQYNMLPTTPAKLHYTSIPTADLPHYITIAGFNIPIADILHCANNKTGSAYIGNRLIESDIMPSIALAYAMPNEAGAIAEYNGILLTNYDSTNNHLYITFITT